MSREIMQQIVIALKALMTGYVGDAEDAIYAIEKELAKPDLSIEANRVAYDVAMHYANKTKEKLSEQEPVSTNDHLCAMLRQVHDVLACTALPMKRQWVGLTDEEIKEVLDLNVAPWSLSGVALQHVMDDARALEAKLKEKNGG
jgi:hypothetical protein